MDRDFKLPPIAEAPTIDDARRALQLLKDLITGWPWATDIDEAVALAAILTAVLRGAFQMAPVFLLTAPKAASGKSFFVDLVAHIVTGRTLQCARQ
jgi:phage/plasmid-associated DNA primase